MHPRPHLDPERLHRLDDRLGASDSTRGPVERGEEAVARRVELSSAVTGKTAADDPMVLGDQLVPTALSCMTVNAVPGIVSWRARGGATRTPSPPLPSLRLG
jgi:hypothetical protein